MIYADLSGQELLLQSKLTVADSVNYLQIKFTFDEEWQGYSKAANFNNIGSTDIYTVVMDGDTVTVPSEVIKAPAFTVALFGVGDGKVITSSIERINVCQSGYGEGRQPSAPTPTVYEQIVGIMSDTRSIAQSLRSDADSGAFKGEKGEKGDTGTVGPKGEKGDTGAAGFSPTATVTKSGKVATISITDSNGTTSATVSDAEITNIDQTYSATSENAQSGKAVTQAIADKYPTPYKSLTTPAAITDSLGGAIRNTVIIGSSYQNGTPTPTAPIEIQNTGNTLTLKSGISADDTNATIYTIPLTDINGTSHIMRQFDEIKKHSDGKWYFDCNSHSVTLVGTESFYLCDTNSVMCSITLPVMQLESYTKLKNAYCSHNPNASAYMTAYSTAGTKLEFRKIVDNWGIAEYTLDSWKSKLAEWNTAGNPLTVEYQTANTTSYELSASTSVILDSIAIQKGNANIYFINSVAPIMTADYFQDLQLYCNSLEARIEALENIQ